MTNSTNIESDLRRLNLINVDQWNKAKWRGVGYVFGGGVLPGIVVAVENLVPGQKLFRDLRARIGDEDTKKLLRVCFVEGDIPGEDPGYTVVIGTDVDNILSDLQSKGQNLPTIGGFLSRPLRCPNSGRLAAFRAEFEKFGHCLIAPGDMEGQPSVGETIKISNVVFRQASEITSNQDPDYLVFTLNG